MFNRISDAPLKSIHHQNISSSGTFLSGVLFCACYFGCVKNNCSRRFVDISFRFDTLGDLHSMHPWRSYGGFVVFCCICVLLLVLVGRGRRLLGYVTLLFSHVVGVGSHRIDTTRRFVFSTNRRNGGPLTSVPCAQMDNYQ
jgi:hypothetical protein